MKKLIGILLLILLVSCTKIQLVKINTNNATVDGNYYVYENSQVKIFYYFWSEGGTMSFYIYNKLNKPIYIDWKKCSFIFNNNKYNYWNNKEKFLGTSSGTKYYNNFFNTINDNTKFSGTRVKNERITFIPPKALVKNPKTFIISLNYINMKNAIKANETKTDIKNPKTIKILKKNFNDFSSPYKFRNFLTFSLSENFTNEFYINNNFYIVEIKEMKKSQFKGKLSNNYENSPYKQPNKYYLIKK